jgi:hypothetical protein
LAYTRRPLECSFTFKEPFVMRLAVLLSSSIFTIVCFIMALQAQPQTHAGQSLTGEWQLTTVEMGIP